ncbi:MAG TPA: hypothetical protein DDW85_10840 [Porphyromonadaceae bacterium]|nr:hypothetical protein [Porphyromonadaceae bacterium]
MHSLVYIRLLKEDYVRFVEIFLFHDNRHDRISKKKNPLSVKKKQEIFVNLLFNRKFAGKRYDD